MKLTIHESTTEMLEQTNKITTLIDSISNKKTTMGRRNYMY